MKLRSFFSVLAVVVSLLVLTAAGGAYWVFAQSPLGLLTGRQATTPSAAMFVPKQAPVMASLLVSPDQLESFRLVAVNPARRRQARAELAQLKQSLFINTGLDYQRDVQPWLGQELTLAVTTLDIDRDAANGQQPGYLLAIATKDPEQSREFLQLFWQKRAIAGTDLTFEQYKGVKLIYGSVLSEQDGRSNAKQSKAPTGKPKSDQDQTSAPLPALASAVVGDQFVLFANHPKVLRDAINNVQAPELSLSHAKFYDQATETLTQPRIGVTFVNLPRLAEWLGNETLQPNQTKATRPIAQGMATQQTLAIALALKRQGLLAETALVTANGKPATALPTVSQPIGALQYLPSNSPLAASGTHLDQLWAELAANLSGYPAAAQFINQPLADLQKLWQIDLPQDIFHWVTGEYALGLLPPETGSNSAKTRGQERRKAKRVSSPGKGKALGDPIDGTDWVFVAQRPKSEASQQAIARLDDLARKQGLSVGPLTLGDRTVYTWTRLTTATKSRAPLSLQADVRGVHTSVGNYELFTTSLAAMDRALKATEASLASQPSFKQATDVMLQPNNGYLYLDWASGRTILEQQFPLLKVIELAGKPLFNHLESLTLSSYGSQAGIQRGGVFIKLS